MPLGKGYNTLTFTDYHEFPVSAVPEPANVSLALFGAAFGMVVAIRRIRNRRQ
jgi:hypothetical protein